jgi:methylenetetrahydrofolate dehydrogenase (NADP+)/methenyltetrahydrofolate cyclohydrolase
MDGGAERGKILAEVSAGVARLEREGKKITLAAVLANREPGSRAYAASQARMAGAHGIEHRLAEFDPGLLEAGLVAEIAGLSRDPGVSGIIILNPPPAGMNQFKLAAAMDPAKDAEGLHPVNLGELCLAGRSDPAPCTAMAALALIRESLGNLSGKRALVIGRSAAVGKPLSLLLLAENATVTIAHSRTDLREVMREAEVVVAAAGAAGTRWRAYEAARRAWLENGGEKPREPDLEPLVRADMIRRGAAVVDIGDNYLPIGFDSGGAPLPGADGRPALRHAGDVDFAKVSEIAGFITPPRGGVGPLTNAFLLRNLVRAALRGNRPGPREAAK